MFDNRELSWLKFNMRVLEEADNQAVPPLERLKFLSIATSNLDEFFMVRVGKLCESIDSDAEKAELLLRLYKATKEFYKKKKAVLGRALEALSENNIRISPVSSFIGGKKSVLYKNFENNILPLLSVQILSPDSPMGYFENKAVYCAVSLNSKGKNYLGLISKSRELESVFLTKQKDFFEFVLTDDIISEYADFLFPGYKVKEKCLFRITRNADMTTLDREFSYIKDYRLKMKKILRKRKKLSPVRIEISNQISKDFKKLINYKANTEMFLINKNPLSFDFLSDMLMFLPEETKEMLSYQTFSPKAPDWFNNDTDMFERIEAGDILLNYPYDSMKPFLRFLEQAAYDETVTSIKISLYRINSDSKVIQSLIKAAERGKDVMVLMELRARFDEENNINYSELLEKNGVTVIFGPEKYKVHSKICTVERIENGKIHYYTHIGTGNYNENTAKIYTDMNLFTASGAVGRDSALFFHNLLSDRIFSDYDEIIVSPDKIEEKIVKKLDSLLENGRAILKCNALTSKAVMDKITNACERGVKVDMIIRGACCLIPDTPKLKENLNIISIVGRFLEHSRIYAFFDGEESEVYISSADLMTRNLKRRIETAIEIKDKKLKEKIIDYLENLLLDDAKAKLLNDKGEYIKKENKITFDSQNYFMYERKEEI